MFESINRSVKIQTWDLVDLGGHCDWDGTTQYMSLFRKATDAWNNYMGTTRFRADTWYTIEDVKISDAYISNSNSKNYAETFPSGKIVFYTKTMNELESDLQRTHTIMHELGHALGLDENRLSTDSEKLGNIMQQGGLAYGTSLSLDDKASYQSASAKY